MKIAQIYLADILANDPEVELVEDMRAELGCVIVPCPFDDGTGDHELHVCNPEPCNNLPAVIYCRSPSCFALTTSEYIDLLGKVLNVRN